MPLAEVIAAQQGAWTPLGLLDARAAFDPKGEAWVYLRQENRITAHPLKAFESGVEGVVLENGVLKAAGAQVKVQALLGALFDAAKHVQFPPVDYALAYEDGGAVPASISLLRRDAEGNFFVSYHAPAELAKIEWLLGIDGILYGVRLEGRTLVFYSEPVPAVKTK
jgi:hypothetical protein